MSKKPTLYGLKSWLSLEDAAFHIAETLSENVGPKDVLQLGIEGKLKLSIVFWEEVYAVQGEIIHYTDARVLVHPPSKILGEKDDYEVITRMESKALAMHGKSFSEVVSADAEVLSGLVTGDLTLTSMSEKYGEETFVTWGSDIFGIEGVWDLPMISGEVNNVKKLYARSSGDNHRFNEGDFASVWVERDGEIYALQERYFIDLISQNGECSKFHSNSPYNPDNWYFSFSFPEASDIVIRRSNLDEFLENLVEDKEAHLEVEDSQRMLEVFGLLVDSYIKGRGPDYLHGTNPKISRIVQDMLSTAPSDVPGMGERKLKEYISQAVKAWSEKKRR